MSVEAMAIFLHHSRAIGTARLVGVGIANHSGDGGAWPSIGTLTKYALVDERNVQAAVRILEALGEVKVHFNDGGTRDTADYLRPNRYEVLLTCPVDCDRSASHRTDIDRMPRSTPAERKAYKEAMRARRMEYRALNQAAADRPKRGGVGEGSEEPGDAGITPSDPVMPASPGDGDITRGVTVASPPGVMPASPEPSLEPSIEPSSKPAPRSAGRAVSPAAHLEATSEPPEPTRNQHAHRIARAYCDTVPLASFHGTRALVSRALTAYPPQDVEVAVQRLAAREATVTLTALRAELTGQQRPRNGHETREESAARLIAHAAALDAAERDQNPHGGPPYEPR